MSTTTSVDAAVAATIPMALTRLADHITEHTLPSPAFIEFPGALVGESEIPEVRVVLDHPRIDPWLASLDSRVEAVVTAHEGGTWHDVHAVANCIRVRLSWYVVAKLEQTVDHETCRGGCGEVLCYCRGREQNPCDGAIEPACHHGEYRCHACMSGCSECADDVRQDRAEGWTR